jgi:uncharacterized integral membrane protein
MTSPYKRRRPSLIRNFWVYRRVVLLAIVLGILLWFMWINSTPVTVVFPFNLATVNSTIGTVILLSALTGSLMTALVMTVIRAIQLRRAAGSLPDEDAASAFPDDRPPADYAAKTTEGFPHFK